MSIENDKIQLFEDKKIEQVRLNLLFCYMIYSYFA